MKIKIIKESQVDAGLDTQLRIGLSECFPHNHEIYATTRRWRGNTPIYNTVAFDDKAKDKICGHAAVIDRTISVGDCEVRIAGVGNVFVLPGYRGKGVSDLIIQTAMVEAKKLGFDFSMLFTSEPIKKVYARNGWIEITDRKFIRVEASQEIALPEESIKMYYPLGEKAFPDGDVHLQGDKW